MPQNKDMPMYLWQKLWRSIGAGKTRMVRKIRFRRFISVILINPYSVANRGLGSSLKYTTRCTDDAAYKKARNCTNAFSQSSTEKGPP